jgi:hypothetical protein
MKRIVLLTLMVIIASVLCVHPVQAQVKKVSGTYKYYGDPNMSVKEVKAAAIENARIQALASEFGTLFTQNTLQEEDLKDGKEHSTFMQMNAAEVKGEWLEDLKDPEILSEELVNGALVVEVRVTGRARAISNETVEFETLTLRNGTTKRHADTNFMEGDDMYLYFKAPVDGYVAVYLIDETQTVSCLIPHEDDGDGQQPVEHGKEYIFFSTQHDEDFHGEDGLKITCEDDRIELNHIHVIYSPNSFFKVNDQQGKPLGYDNLHRPRQLSLKEFTRWMSKLSGHDNRMGRKVIQIKIKKQ